MFRVKERPLMDLPLLGKLGLHSVVVLKQLVLCGYLLPQIHLNLLQTLS